MLELPVAEIADEDGVAKIIAKLDGLYLKDKAQSAYEAYDKFETFKRPSDMLITDFINEFEKLYRRSESFGTKLSTDVQVIKICEYFPAS